MYWQIFLQVSPEEALFICENQADSNNVSEVRNAIQHGREVDLMKLVRLTVKGGHFPTQIHYVFHSASGSSVLGMGCKNVMFSDGRKTIFSPVY